MRVNRTNPRLIWIFNATLALFVVVVSSCAEHNFPEQEQEGLSVYRNTVDNPYRNVLLSCVMSSCSLRELPFIGMESTTPKVDDLLNRLVVSHRWMGTRFEEVIRALNTGEQNVVLQLSRSIAGVVIGSEIRPSYYKTSNSVIYLDPLRMALSDQERSVVDQTPDYRSGFGDELQFVGVWRYVTSENEYFYTNDPAQKTLQDVVHSLTRLLFHELAHANDYYSHNTIAEISCESESARCGRTPWGNYATWASRNQLSAQFGVVANPQPNTYHLRNRDMEAYARIRYRGQSPSDAQKHVHGNEIGGWMASDAATHDYAYHTSREDVAMLIEAALTKYLFDADMDIGYIDKPDSENETVGPSTPVSWGQRGRLGDPVVARRAKRIVDLMLPGFIPESFFTNLEEPQFMQTECGWRDNLDLSCSSSDQSRQSIIGEENSKEDVHSIEYDMRPPHW